MYFFNALKYKLILSKTFKTPHFFIFQGFLGNFTNSKLSLSMTIQHFIFKYGRYATFILFIIVLFLKYFSFPDFVAVNFTNSGDPSGFLPKSQLFYLLISLLILLNTIVPLITKVYKKYIKIQSHKQIILSTHNFENIVNLAIFLTNIFLLIALFILAKINSSEYSAKVTYYVWFLYALPLIPASIVFYFTLKFKKQ